MKGKWSDRKGKILAALKANPSATMHELMDVLGLERSSNIWYHMKAMAMQGVSVGQGITVAMIVQRLQDDARKARVAGNVSRAARRTPRKLQGEMERIDAVVAKAKEREARGDVPAGVDMIHDFRGSLSIHGAKVG